MHRRSLALLVLAACDFRPAPPREAPKPAEGRGSIADSGNVAVADPPPARDACLDVATHVGELWVASATDPAQKAVYEQERTKTVKTMTDVCTRDAWSDAARRCYLAAAKWLDIEKCAALIKR